MVYKYAVPGAAGAPGETEDAMVVFLWVIGALLVAALASFMAYASTVGGLGVLTRSRYERCPRCGHHGLVRQGRLHPGSCPPAAGHRLARLAHGGHGLHLPHH